MEFGLIGYPLSHSFSKKYFTEKFLKEHIDARFHNFELNTVDELPSLLNEYPHLIGIAVTRPYKKSVLRFLTASDAVVQQTGSCNCIKIVDGKLYGFNTDVTGFKKSVMPFIQPRYKALILGTGGAAEAVAFALQQLSVKFSFVSRTGTNENFLRYSEIDEQCMDQYKLIINCTPVGTFPDIDEAPPIPYDLISSAHVMYDLVYNPEKTTFLRLAEEKGASIKNGLEMLEIQAEENYRIWIDDSI